MDDSLHDRVPAGLQPSILGFPPLTLRCCCGRPDCAYLQHSYAALEGLEKNLATAARLGQVKSTTLGPKIYITPPPLICRGQSWPGRFSPRSAPHSQDRLCSKQAGDVADSSSAGPAASP